MITLPLAPFPRGQSQPHTLGGRRERQQFGLQGKEEQR